MVSQCKLKPVWLRQRIVIVAIWVLMLAVNTPVLIKYGVMVDDGEPICSISSELAAGQLYATFFTFAYLIPLTVIVFFSVGILRHIMRHKAPVTSSMTSSASALSGASCNPGSLRGAGGGGRKQSRSVDKKRQAGRTLVAVLGLCYCLHLDVSVGRTLVLVVVMFAALWLPVHIHLLRAS